MAKSTPARMLWRIRAVQGFLPFTFLLLFIEFFDELYYGVQSAALPVLRADLGMSYAQTGLLLSLPTMASVLIEPVLMALGDTRLRKTLIVSGGLTIAAASLALSAVGSFPLALLAFAILFPASGAFVSLSQATLMDLNPGRQAQMMARWTVFGSLGSLLGPALLALMYTDGLTWRSAYWLLAGLGLVLALFVMAHRFDQRPGAEPGAIEDPEQTTPLKHAPISLARLPNAIVQALHTPGLLRWFILLDFADLMLDVHASFAALYFADVVGLNPGQLGLVMSALMAADLLSTLMLIPVLEHIPGRRLLRFSAWITAGLYVAWMLIPGAWAKIVLAVALRCSTIGWYEVLQGEAYATLPGRSGLVMAINSVMGLLGASLVWIIGQAAETAGLPAAMWLLLAGPLALIWLAPRDTTL